MSKLILISVGSLSDAEFPFLEKMSYFRSFIKKGTVIRNTDSVFLSRPYPAHASLLTGCVPFRHGILDDTFYRSHPPVPYRSLFSSLRYHNIPSALISQGGTAASILWPTTVGAPIQWNLPELSPFTAPTFVPGCGSAKYQLSMLSRHAHLLRTQESCYRDSFALSCALDTLREYRPDLLLLRFTELDDAKRRFGLWSAPALSALRHFDRHLGLLLDAAPDYHILFLGAYASLPVRRALNPCRILGDDLLPYARFYLSGGCAFFHIHRQAPSSVSLQAKQLLSDIMGRQNSGIERFLTEDEMIQAGLDSFFDFGIEAQRGVCFGAFQMAQHGYSLRHKDYRCFTAALGQSIPRGHCLEGGNIVDSTALALRILGLPPWAMEGSYPL